jgi:acylphosphatase
MRNVQMIIRGRVQGVGFRYNAKSLARNLGLAGYIKNLPDDSVFIEVEGDEPVMDEFIQWCHQGPIHAIVEKVEIEKGEIKNLKGFETKF